MPNGGRLRVQAGNATLGDGPAQALALPPGDYVTLSVCDTGTGMPPEVKARAFDPFFTTKPVGEGTGLGLSMIYGFVRQSGGQVQLDSRPGEGTELCLYLPRHVGPPEAVSPPSEPALAPHAGEGARVLVVDDEASVRMLVTDLLEELDYKVLQAADGPAALQRLQAGERIDLLVSDIGLPGGMNGSQLATAALALRPGLKILFITGYADAEMLSPGSLPPGAGLLGKPFTMAALAGRVQEMLAVDRVRG
jgi:CheY-like chemotaxis protein